MIEIPISQPTKSGLWISSIALIKDVEIWRKIFGGNFRPIEANMNFTETSF